MITLFFSWHDSITIAVLTVAIYYFSIWLRHDQHRNLLGFFYGYCIAYAGCSFLNLHVLASLLVVTSPLALVLLVLVHQTTLQKNFVALTSSRSQNTESPDWIEIFMRSLLISCNRSQTIGCVIEHTQELAGLMATALRVDAPLQEDLLALIFDSPSYQHERYLWLTSPGTVMGINALWHMNSVDEQTVADWKQAAQFLTTKTDALVIRTNPTTRTVCIVIGGILYDNIRIGDAAPFIKKYLVVSASKLSGESFHGTQNQKVHQHQRTP